MPIGEDRHIRECTYQGGPCICSLLSRYGARVRSKTLNKTMLSERDRIRQAVEALGPMLNVGKYDGGYDCCGCSTLDQLHEDVLSIINGDSVEQNAAPELNNEQLSPYNGEWQCNLYGHDYDDAVICRVCNHDGCEMGSQ